MPKKKRSFKELEAVIDAPISVSPSWFEKQKPRRRLAFAAFLVGLMMELVLLSLLMWSVQDVYRS